MPETTHNSTVFTPSEEQLVFANAYIESQGNIREAFKSIERDRAIYYKCWRTQEGFEEWLSGYAKSEVLKRVGKWYLLLEKHAERGSFNHLDRLLEIGKEFSPKVGGVQVNVFPSKTLVFKDIDDSGGEADIRSVHEPEGTEGSRAQG